MSVEIARLLSLIHLSLQNDTSYTISLVYLINHDPGIAYLAHTQYLHREAKSKMAEGSQHGGHPIVKSIEEKLRAAITVEHFVCHPAPSSLLRDKGI